MSEAPEAIQAASEEVAVTAETTIVPTASAAEPAEALAHEEPPVETSDSGVPTVGKVAVESIGSGAERASAALEHVPSPPSPNHLGATPHPSLADGVQIRTGTPAAGIRRASARADAPRVERVAKALEDSLNDHPVSTARGVVGSAAHWTDSRITPNLPPRPLGIERLLGDPKSILTDTAGAIGFGPQVDRLLEAPAANAPGSSVAGPPSTAVGSPARQRRPIVVPLLPGGLSATFMGARSSILREDGQSLAAVRSGPMRTSMSRLESAWNRGEGPGSAGAGEGRNIPLPREAPSPPASSLGASAGSFFIPIVVLLALLALAEAATHRRRWTAADIRPPTPFVCALERPG